MMSRPIILAWRWSIKPNFKLLMPNHIVRVWMKAKTSKNWTFNDGMNFHHFRTRHAFHLNPHCAFIGLNYYLEKCFRHCLCPCRPNSLHAGSYYLKSSNYLCYWWTWSAGLYQCCFEVEDFVKFALSPSFLDLKSLEKRTPAFY